jgi:hypothetical protein
LLGFEQLVSPQNSQDTVPRTSPINPSSRKANLLFQDFPDLLQVIEIVTGNL